MVLCFYFWSMGEQLPIGHMVFEKISSFGLFGGVHGNFFIFFIFIYFFQFVDT